MKTQFRSAGASPLVAFGWRWCFLWKPRLKIGRVTVFAAVLVWLALWGSGAAELPDTPLFSVHEVALQATGRYGNPYRELEANAVLTPLNGGSNRTASLFWDGGTTWNGTSSEF